MVSFLEIGIPNFGSWLFVFFVCVANHDSKSIIRWFRRMRFRGEVTFGQKSISTKSAILCSYTLIRKKKKSRRSFAKCFKGDSFLHVTNNPIEWKRSINIFDDWNDSFGEWDLRFISFSAIYLSAHLIRLFTRLLCAIPLNHRDTFQPLIYIRR